MVHVENLEQRVHFAAHPAIPLKVTPSIDVAVSSESSSFGASAERGAKGIETIALQNLGGVTATGRITFVLSITGSDGTAYPLRVTLPTRAISVRSQATKTFSLHVVLPSTLPSDSNYVLTGDFSVLSGFTDLDPDNDAVDLSATPITISNAGVGYFTFSPFSATQMVGSARAGIFEEMGTVTAYPGGSVEYQYTEQFGVGTLQITSTTSDVDFAYFLLSIYHHAPARLNGKTISIVASAKGASGSGSLVEEGLAIPGITYNQQVAYYKLT